MAAGLILLCCASAQELHYEVASIRPAPADHRNGIGPSGGPGTEDPTRVRYGFFPLRILLMTAYGMNIHQIVIPAQVDSGDRFDVVANVPPGATKEQSLVMLQNFLIDRFHLKLHRETRTLVHYELVVGSNGFKLKPYANGPARRAGTGIEDGDIGVRVGADRNHMSGRRVGMKVLTRVLSDDLDTPVLDKTGIEGEYDFDFDYSREGLDGFHRSLTEAPEPSGAPTLQIALQESLGLKLETKKGPLDLLVVDSGNRVPSEN